MKSKLAYKESIADLWGCPDGQKSRPSTARLFTAIAAESFACLFHIDWYWRIKRIENCLSVIKWRINRHEDEWFSYQLQKSVEKAKGDQDVGHKD